LPDGWYCEAKPVIYLYPTKPTLVDVTMTMEEGHVLTSDPLYDEGFHGWQGVTAYPDGTLSYHQKSYKELFYESAIKDVKAPNNGIIISTNQLKPELVRITTALGLTATEQAEFLSYWLPALNDLHKPYILFSLISDSEKQRIDKVDISPKPDTFIYISAYFKALNQPINIEPLVLPQTPPKRVGFTAVEWGGTIEHQ
jgi:hypothetical protein